ncbi:MAG: transposase zinc-binding domain-containing protein [gamma proteobacterium endosymbiont of Lamellibrachia anaximandri]|nr:transposase zinc-binding domain-containing protein [gamma proteobacterium endosymbiont of Lamellibrachia anaximandri]
MDDPSQGCIPTPYHRRDPANTPLYRVMQNHLETFIALCHDDWEDESISPYAERALRRYLECGILAYGFARARCAECGYDFLVAFSSKGRGACPSCNSRHIVETAAHLVDHVFPPLPVRQWVLSLPKRLRYHLQHDPKVLNSVLRIFLDQIERHLRDHSPGAGEGARIGAVAFIHRFGASLNQHIHFHVCVIDGVFESDGKSSVRFFPLGDLGSDDIEAIQSQVRPRILLAFVRRGILDKDERKEMAQWDHGGGFSLDYGVLAPNAPLRTVVTALAPEAIEAASPPASAEEDDADETLQRSPARYLWAMLLARIYETFDVQGCTNAEGAGSAGAALLTCPSCGAEMRIIALTYKDVLMPQEAGCRERPFWTAAVCDRSSIISVSPPLHPGSPRHEVHPSGN